MTEDQTTEPNRARVRRLLIEPVQDAGMRFPKGVKEERQKAYIARLCDDVGYLSDLELACLSEWIKRNGEGSQRTFWPSRVAIIRTAHGYRKRDLEETSLAGWFRSRAGEAALVAGDLVSIFYFVQEHFRPPRLDGSDAQWMQHRRDFRSIEDEVTISRERAERGLSIGADATAQMAWFEGLERRAKALVDEGIAKRAAQQEDAA